MSEENENDYNEDIDKLKERVIRQNRRIHELERTINLMNEKLKKILKGYEMEEIAIDKTTDATCYSCKNNIHCESWRCNTINENEYEYDSESD